MRTHLKKLGVIVFLLLSMTTLYAADAANTAAFVSAVEPIAKKLICFGESLPIYYDNDTNQMPRTGFWMCDGTNIKNEDFVCPTGYVAVGVNTRHFTQAGAEVSRCSIRCAKLKKVNSPSKNCQWMDYNYGT